jgi:isopentenyl diphosphate isomerase/L-lactate dehydrogenase-like FMN-dependent dehydrogenase
MQFETKEPTDSGSNRSTTRFAASLSAFQRIGLMARVLCNVMTSDWSGHFIGPDGKTPVPLDF